MATPAGLGAERGPPERSDYLDRLAVLRNQVFVLDHMYMSLLGTIGWLVRLAITLVLLASIDPVLLLLAALRRADRDHLVLASRPSSGRSRSAAPRTAGWPTTCSRPRRPPRPARRSGSPASGRTWRRGAGPSGSAGTPRSPGPAGSRPRGTRWPGRSSGSATSARSSSSRSASSRRRRRCCWSWRPAPGSSSYVGGTIGEIGFLRGIWMDGSRRLVWLEDYVAAFDARADLEVPDRIDRGHPVRAVTFAYPGTDRTVLGRHRPDPAGGRGGGDRRGERGRASRPWSSCWPSCTSRRRVGS